MMRKVQSPTQAVPDDGFPRYQISKTQEEFAEPKSRREFVANTNEAPAKFITRETIPEAMCADTRRPMNDVPKSGFRAVLTRHDQGEFERNWDTSTGRSFPETAQQTADFAARDEAIKNKSAGVSSLKQKPVKQVSLVGENSRVSNIPVQRSWMQIEDPGLRELNKNGTVPRPLPAEDNELSLPVGDGQQKKIMKSLQERGNLYRTKTAITTGKGNKNMVSVWEDYP